MVDTNNVLRAVATTRCAQSVNQVFTTPELAFFPLHEDTVLLGTGGEAGEAPCIPNGKRKVSSCSEAREGGGARSSRSIKCHLSKKP